MSGSLPLGKAITGFVNHKTAKGLSDRFVDSYRRILEHWADFAEKKKVAQFTDHSIDSSIHKSIQFIQLNCADQAVGNQETGSVIVTFHKLVSLKSPFQLHLMDKRVINSFPAQHCFPIDISGVENNKYALGFSVEVLEPQSMNCEDFPNVDLKYRALYNDFA